MQSLKTTFIAFLAIMITVGTLWLTNRPVALKQATWDDVLAEAERGEYDIITTEELAELYRAPASDPLLFDTRQEWEYRTGHIAGALNFSMEPTWWARWSSKDEMAEFLGPDKDRLLVFY